MIYITGDTHGDQILWDVCIHSFLKENDTIIIAGDFGMGFFDGRWWSEEMFFDHLEQQNYTVLFVDGNHEDFNKLNSYPVSQWNGGRVHRIRKNVIHLMRGEIYEIEGKRLLAFGGGYSLDKEMRVPGRTWWPEEMPSEEEYTHGIDNLERVGNQVDYIITHTCPRETVEYMASVNRLGINKNVAEELPLTAYLQSIQWKVSYRKWYFGHFHLDRELWRNQYVLLNGIRELESGEWVKDRLDLGKHDASV